MMIIRVLPIHVPPCYEGGYLKPLHWKHIWLMMIIWSDPSMFHDAVSPWSLHIYHYEAMQGQGPHFPPTGGRGGRGSRWVHYIGGGWGGGLPNLDHIYIFHWATDIWLKLSTWHICLALPKDAWKKHDHTSFHKKSGRRGLKVFDSYNDIRQGEIKMIEWIWTKKREMVSFHIIYNYLGVKKNIYYLYIYICMMLTSSPASVFNQPKDWKRRMFLKNPAPSWLDPWVN